MKKVIILLILITFCVSLTACYDAREVDDLAYVIAIGLDKGKNSSLKITFQIAIPKNLGGGGDGSQGGGSQGGKSSAFENITIEAPAINPSFDMVNAFVGRDLLLSHTKAVIVSEELAKEGILHLVREMIRNREFRRKMTFVVSRTTAEEYIRSINPALEINPAKYYDLHYNSGRYTGTSPYLTLLNMYNRMMSADRQPAAILASVNKSGLESNKSTAENKNRNTPFEADFYSGDIPKKSSLPAEIMGTAVFDGSKFVGELDGESTYHYLLGCNEYGRAVWTFNDPLHSNQKINLTVIKNRDTQVRVKILNGIPNINVSIDLEGDIISIHSGENYEDPEKLKVLENYVNQHIKNGFINTFNILSKKYKSDIYGFGRSAKVLFPTWKSWENFNWEKRFSQSNMNVKVNFHIRRGGLIIKSHPAVSSEGKE